MGYTIPGVDDFKAQFPRDFPYAVPSYGAQAAAVITSGIVSSVVVTAGGKGYVVAPTVTITPNPPSYGSGATAVAVINGTGQVTGVTVETSGSGYVGATVGFTGGAGDDSKLDYVQDEDIQGAILDASFNTTDCLFANQQQYTRGFLYLAAHQLIEKIQMWQEGSQSQYAWLTAAKSIADASESFQFPERITQDPWLSHVSKTRYGAMYIQIISPQLIGNVITAFRFTLP